MDIKSLHHNPVTGTTTVEFSTKENDGADIVDHTLRTQDPPQPKMLKLLASLGREVEALCELPDGYVTEVRKVAWHPQEQGDELVTVACLHKIDGVSRPLVLNAPPYPHDATAFSSLRDMTAAFVQGRRAQGELPLAKPEAPPAARKTAPAARKSKARPKKADLLDI